MKKIKIPAPSESVEAKIFVQWLRMKNLFFIHVPNEGKRRIKTAMLLRAMGMTPGAHDFIIFNTVPCNGKKGVTIEMKRHEKNSKPTKNQLNWQKEMIRLGWESYITHGADAAIKVMLSLGY